MFCYNCGKEISGETEICQHCGTSQQKNKVESQKQKRNWLSASGSILTLICFFLPSLQGCSGYDLLKFINRVSNINEMILIFIAIIILLFGIISLINAFTKNVIPISNTLIGILGIICMTIVLWGILGFPNINDINIKAVQIGWWGEIIGFTLIVVGDI